MKALIRFEKNVRQDIFLCERVSPFVFETKPFISRVHLSSLLLKLRSDPSLPDFWAVMPPWSEYHSKTNELKFSVPSIELPSSALPVIRAHSFGESLAPVNIGDIICPATVVKFNRWLYVETDQWSLTTKPNEVLKSSIITKRELVILSRGSASALSLAPELGLASSTRVSA